MGEADKPETPAKESGMWWRRLRAIKKSRRLQNLSGTVSRNNDPCWNLTWPTSSIGVRKNRRPQGHQEEESEYRLSPANR